MILLPVVHGMESIVCLKLRLLLAAMFLNLPFVYTVLRELVPTVWHNVFVFCKIITSYV